MRSILLVDDEAEFRDTFKEVLELNGYQVSTAEHGESAVAMVAHSRYQLVIMDVRVPCMDGITALQEILRIRPESFVIMVTAFRLTEGEEQVVKGKAKGVFTKPLDLESFLKTLGKLLGEEG